MRLRILRLAAGAAFAVFAVVGVALGTWVIAESYSPVPYADFWAQIPFLERAYEGDLSVADFWAQAGDHRILVARIQFVVDYRLFDGTYVFLFSAIAVSSLVLAAAFAAVALLETGDRLLGLGTFCVSAIATMSPVGRENLWWAYQVQFVQVFLFATLAILAVVVAARSTAPTPRRLWIGASATAAVAASYSMTNGLVVWPVVLALAVLLGLGRRATATLGLVAVATFCSYLWHLDFHTRANLSDPVRLVGYACVYLGSVIRELGSPTAAGVLGGVGIGLLGLLCVLAWRSRAGRSIAVPFGAGVALFVLASALQTGAGRIDLGGLPQALSSRYTIASTTFWLALLVAFLAPLRERFRAASPAYLVGAAILALVLAMTGLPSRTFLRTEVVGKETTVLAYLAGVDDPSGTLTGGPSGSVVSDAFRWMEEEGLGPWAPGGIAEDMQFTVPPAEDRPECPGSVDFVDPVGGGLRLTGWIAAPARGGEASRNLAVLDTGGEPQGRGRVGTYRPDVQDSGAAESEWTGFVAYASGEPAPRPLVLVLVGEDRRSAVCRLESP